MAKHDCCASCCCCCSHNLVDQLLLLLLLWFAASTFCRATLRFAFQFTFSRHFLFGAFKIDFNFDFCYFILLNFTHFSNTVRRGPSAIVTKAPINSDRSTLVRCGSLGYWSRLAIPFLFVFFCFFASNIFVTFLFCCYYVVVALQSFFMAPSLCWLCWSDWSAVHFSLGFALLFLCIYLFLIHTNLASGWLFFCQRLETGVPRTEFDSLHFFAERVFLSGYVLYFFCCLGIMLCAGLDVVHVIKSHC